MGLFSKKQDDERQGLMTKEDVLNSFRQACWDLFISNLPDPVIVDTDTPEAKKDKRVPADVPRGFSIDPKDWTTYFNMKDIPKHLADKKDLTQYARSIFQHEETHFTQVPADGLTEAVLIDSALKGFNDPSISNDKELASAFAHISLNVMGDLIGDTLLAKESYGREDFGDLTLWRMKETIKEARQTPQPPSLLWQTLVSSYEKLWDEDLGLDDYIQQRNNNAEKAAESLVSILGNDWKDRRTWEDKIKGFAKTLEPVIKQTIQEAAGQGQSRYSGRGGKGRGAGKGGKIIIPDDVITQMGDPTESSIDKNGNGEKISKGKGQDQAKGTGVEETVQVDERILDEIYQRNKEAPGSFAGTMGALLKVEPDDALRLMYRARARELLMSLKEKENQMAERSPGFMTDWNPGDPIMGKGGLEIIPSMMSSGKPVPTITTYKRKLLESKGYGRLKMIPDLFIVIDSSGSMSWKPWDNPPDARGDFDKAILAAEGAALYAFDNGGRVAVINFSGQGNVTTQDYTTDIDKIEKAVMVNYSGGTVVPVDDVRNMIKKTKNPLLTCFMSDCDVSDPENACDNGLAYAISEHDTLAVFNINKGIGAKFTNRIKQRGAIIYPINKIKDLVGIIIGEVKRKYDESGRLKGGKQDAN